MRQQGSDGRGAGRADARRDAPLHRASWVRARVAAAAFALVGSVTQRAFANGRFPRAQYLVVGPGRSDELFALRTTFGLVVSDDGAQRFRFLCEEAFQYQDGYDPSLAWTATGALLVGVADGLQRSPDLCDPQRLRDFEQWRVVDLSHDLSGRTIAAVMQSRDAVPVTRFARSTDAGDTWDVAPRAVDATTPLTIDVAPSDGRRMYATLIPSPFSGSGTFVYRSDDGGLTWRATAATLRGFGPMFLAGVDPTRPDTLYARGTVRGEVFDGGFASATALLRSDDGGESWREVGRTQGPMLGFAVSGDGRSVWIGGPNDGLSRSEDGGAFQQRSRDGVDCLRWHAGALYLCDTLGGARGSVLLSRSRDGGDTREVLARVEDVLPPPARCPQVSVVRSFCANRWTAVRPFVLASTVGDAGRDAAMDAPPDAGVGGGGGGCDGCVATPRTGEDTATIATWMLLIAALRRRHSRAT